MSVFFRQEDSHQKQDQTNDGCYTGKTFATLITVTPERQILIQSAVTGSFSNAFTVSNLPNQVQTTLSVVEEERDRFMSKLLNEEKARKTLEGQMTWV